MTLKYYFLLLLVALFLSYSSLQLKAHKSISVTEELQSWTDLEKRSVHKITLKKNDIEIQFFKNQVGSWIMMKPEKIIAEQIYLHQILEYVFKPNVQRVFFLPKSHSPYLRNGVSVNLNFNQKLIQSVYYFIPHQNHFVYWYFPKNKTVLKVEKNAELFKDLNFSEFFIQKVLPFKLESIHQIIYKREEIEKIFENTKTGWVSSTVPSETWKTVLNKFNYATCIEYISECEIVKKIASYHFIFKGGQQSLLELLLDKHKGYVLNYKGTKRYQVISAETASMLFPKSE